MSEIHKQLIQGLEEKLRALRARKDLFAKAQGLEEEAAKSQIKLQDMATEIAEEQKTLDALLKQKNQVVSGVCKSIEAKMGEILPYGKATFKIVDGELFIAWNMPGMGDVPIQGLSGGESAAFRPALGYILAGEGSKMIVIEAAELDDEKFDLLINHLAENPMPDCQIIVNTCHKPANVPESWSVTELL